MNAEENAQVALYISQLQSSHQQALYLATHAGDAERRARLQAQASNLKMGEAIGEIYKLSRQEPATLNPQQFAACVLQIINYYCPDWDIPF
jgi:uncharacterized protein YggE